MFFHLYILNIVKKLPEEYKVDYSELRKKLIRKLNNEFNMKFSLFINIVCIFSRCVAYLHHLKLLFYRYYLRNVKNILLIFAFFKIKQSIR